MKKKAVRRSGGKAVRRVPWRLIGISFTCALVMFVIGYFIAVRLLFPPLPAPKNGIVVPRLAGMTVEQAEQKLRALGLRITETIDIVHPTQPRGIIIAQSPLAGQQLRAAGAVQVGVSAGPPRPQERLTAPTPDRLTADTARRDTTVFDTIPTDTIP